LHRVRRRATTTENYSRRGDCAGPGEAATAQSGGVDCRKLPLFRWFPGPSLPLTPAVERRRRRRSCLFVGPPGDGGTDGPALTRTATTAGGGPVSVAYRLSSRRQITIRAAASSRRLASARGATGSGRTRAGRFGVGRSVGRATGVEGNLDA
jgi:hypothetical protein